jgi:hypothetical protein
MAYDLLRSPSSVVDPISTTKNTRLPRLPPAMTLEQKENVLLNYSICRGLRLIVVCLEF